ncbi:MULTISPECIES: hypothetical protein [Mammaliicoccus]|uniref:Uncharacterized protein n=2 Tax=Mammaliicoccus fleurettii TaxID=150056 RepID=A0ABS5MLZ9_9STAP|nr:MULTISPECIES: hypothetical protein [Mammaliicoccus]HCN60983.1 hypothetical protein [Staphylococcus sp.]MBL0847116.1 hypothetical protein [Mammaliicoccus fleurettii]MBS3671889.1 hypothetical protein [Mammaliicoccus fleurettii]MBS3696916.1 hypothetical protein [Mammaliicoccus fleurettii]MBW0763927.1 hypothetical protein [Mammaliicoccus fleurettii]
MFRDMAFYIFGKPLDSFVQLFIFEPIVIGIIAILIAMITKKSWTVFITIIALNIIDNFLLVNYQFGGQGIGTIISQNILFFFEKFFSMFYEILIAYIIVKLPIMHSKFKIA